MDCRSKYERQNNKASQKKTQNIFMTLEWAKFPLKGSKTTLTRRGKQDNLENNNIKKLCPSKDIINKMKRQCIEQKIFAANITNNLYPEYIKNFLQINDRQLSRKMS